MLQTSRNLQIYSDIRAARQVYQGCRRVFGGWKVRSDRYVPVNHSIIDVSDTLRFSDNTNADSEVRSKWIELATKHAVPIRCVLFTAGSEICEHNDSMRALNNMVCVPSVLNEFSSPIPTNGCHVHPQLSPSASM